MKPRVTKPPRAGLACGLWSLRWYDGTTRKSSLARDYQPPTMRHPYWSHTRRALRCN